MKRTPVVLGIDLGSSAAKHIAVSLLDGVILNSARREYDHSAENGAPVPAHVYEDELVRILNDALVRYDVKSIGLTGQMYSILAAYGERLVVWQWNSAWHKNAAAQAAMAQMYETTGCPARACFPLYKLLSSEAEERRGYLPYDIKAHLIEFLTGQRVTDYSTASSSGLFLVKERAWNRALAESLGFSADALPLAIQHNRVAGTIRNPRIKTNGAIVSVAPALGDGPSASYACKDLSNMCCNVGTSSAVRTITSDSACYTDASLWRFALDDEAMIVGDISASCCSVIHGASTLMRFDRDAVDAGECRFYPFLAPDGIPRTQDALEACFAGTGKGASDAMRSAAITQAIGFTVCRMAQRLMAAESGIGMLVAVGGGMHIPAIRDVVTHTLPVRVGVLRDAAFLAAQGAALSAAEALGCSIKFDHVPAHLAEPDGKYALAYRRWKAGAADV